MKAKPGAKDSSQSPERLGTVPRGEQVPFVCPECHGPLWEMRNGKQRRYQCLVGHRYSLESLVAGHAEDLEAALWIALRALEERIALQRKLAEECRTAGRKSGEKMFRTRLAENAKHAAMLRGILEKAEG